MGVHRCRACSAWNRVPESRMNDAPICGSCKARLDVRAAPEAVTGEALERIVATAPVPVFVDFWAEWCGPCRMAAPAVEEIAKRNAGRVLVLKVNVDEEGASASRFRVEGIPAFLLFEGGREVARRAGLSSRAELETWMAAHVRGGHATSAPGG